MGTLSFKEIIGQEKATVFLRQVIANDKIASAYLFAGIQGIGKTTTAMAFALLLNCVDPVDGDGCGKCPSCKKIIDGNHPDLMVIEPDQEKKVIGINRGACSGQRFYPECEGSRGTASNHCFSMSKGPFQTTAH
jgi:DNA polymerase III delta prime subunit